MFLCQTGWNPDCSLPDNKVEKSSFGKSRKSHGIYISAAAGAFLLVGAHQSGSTCSSWSLSSLPLSLCQTHSFSVILASLLSIFSLLPLVLKQAVYCVCSAEQPALKDVCECLSQPACQTVLIPSEAWLTSSSPCPFFFSLSLLLAYVALMASWHARPPVSHSLLASLWANHTEGNPLLTSQDQTAIRSQWLWVYCTACYRLPWCFAGDQCLSPTRREKQGGKVCVTTGSNRLQAIVCHMWAVSWGQREVAVESWTWYWIQVSAEWTLPVKGVLNITFWLPKAYMLSLTFIQQSQISTGDASRPELKSRSLYSSCSLCNKHMSGCEGTADTLPNAVIDLCCM